MYIRTQRALAVGVSGPYNRRRKAQRNRQNCGCFKGDLGTVLKNWYVNWYVAKWRNHEKPVK